MPAALNIWKLSLLTQPGGRRTLYSTAVPPRHNLNSCLRGGVKVPTGGDAVLYGEPASSAGTMVPAADSGVIPEPTVRVRMKEECAKGPLRVAAPPSFSAGRFSLAAGKGWRFG